MKKKYIWIILGILVIIMLVVAFNLNGKVGKTHKINKKNKDITLISVSYSVDSTSGKVNRKSLFVNENLYILTIEQSNDNNELEVREYAVDSKKWNNFKKNLDKYNIEKMSLKKADDDIENVETINVAYKIKDEIVEYNISSNMKLSKKEKKIFNEVNTSLEKLEIEDKKINDENRENY